MTPSFKSVTVATACLALLGASLGTAEALPVAPMQAGAHAAVVDQVSYKRNHYASHRKPNRLRSRTVCGNMPSRC